MANTGLVAGRQRNLSGWLPDRPDHRDMLYKVPRKLKATRIPSSVDLRRFCSKIEDQGDVGSCTANTVVNAMEFLYLKAGVSQPDLSRLFVYYNTRVKLAKSHPQDDSGAQLRDAVKSVAKYGVCLEKNWPYNTSAFSMEPPAPAYAEALDHQITYYYRLPNLGHIRLCLAEGYPCTLGFAIPESAMTDKVDHSGDIPYPGKKEPFVGGHAVLVVGYDDKTKKLCFKNSWGTGWGNQGYGTISYAYVDNYLANDFWTIRRQEM